MVDCDCLLLCALEILVLTYLLTYLVKYTMACNLRTVACVWDGERTPIAFNDIAKGKIDKSLYYNHASTPAHTNKIYDNSAVNR